MRQTLSAALFICFIFFTSLQAQTVTPANLLKQLLDLPAPPPDESLAKMQKQPIYDIREEKFYAQNRVPPDDAPLEELLDYWAMQSGLYRPLRYNIKPAEKSLERILEYCEDNPEELGLFLNVLPRKPDTAEKVKRLYTRMTADETPLNNALKIRKWLLFNSDAFIDELVKDAEKVKDKNEYVTNQAELLALTRVAWEKAVPILERLTADNSQPVSAILAKWAYYAHALESGDDNDISKYRRQLQDVVENRNMSPGSRDLAFDALVSEKDWDGRDEWYLSLLSDETLYDLKVNGQSYTGLTTLLLYSPPEKYVRLMASLVENRNPTVRKAAIKNLVTYLDEGNIDAVRALLPWLSNPNWMSDLPNGRAALITALGKVDLPESVPDLITILTNEPQYLIPAVQALAKYKDARAVPALKLALSNEILPYKREILIHSIIECGGLSDDEKMAALEIYATAISTPEGREKLNQALVYSETENKQALNIPLNTIIGKFVAEQIEPTDGLADRAIERLRFLRKSKPAVAATLAEIMRNWKGRVIYIETLRQIREGEFDLEMLLNVLARRKEIREKAPNDVFAMRNARGIGRGIGACLGEENNEFLSILGQKDTEAQTAMLGCARLLRVKLPVGEVGAVLKNENKTLALAAERYLESEDSVEARSIILAQHPNEALILGARYAFVPDPKNGGFSPPLNELFQTVVGRRYFGINHPTLDKSEEMLRNEIKTNPDLLAIYAVLPYTLAGQQIVRVFKDRISFRNYEDPARYREKILSAKEYEDFYRLILDEKIDTTAPVVGNCGDCPGNEFVMFGHGGGRRVFFTGEILERSPLKKILERFASFSKGELSLHYLLADKIKGLEVLLADDKFEARSVWKNGADLRVLVEDEDKKAEIAKDLNRQFEIENSAEIDEDNYEELQKRRESQEKRTEENKYAHYFWRSIENKKLGGILPQPLEIPFLYDENQVPETTGMNPAPRAWQVRAGNYEIRTDFSEASGLYKVSRLQDPVKIKDGNYNFPIVSADGNWVIISKSGKNWQDPDILVRINLQTGKEFPINLPPADVFKAVAFINGQGKVLIYRARGKKYSYDREYEREYQGDEDEDKDEAPIEPDKNDKNPSPLTPEYYLLDPATGATQPVKGEFRPLEQQTYRPLQATTAPNEFWAAVYDKKAKETAIGRYNTKTFVFQPVTRFPDIRLDSMNIWVDEKESKVYFVYESHLLVAPLPTQKK